MIDVTKKLVLKFICLYKCKLFFLICLDDNLLENPIDQLKIKILMELHQSLAVVSSLGIKGSDPNVYDLSILAIQLGFLPLLEA
ncbi:hypothetical protein QVD17_36131 [Tagetes erecta]|uniref:Uncharacterized protein n=1 Tax=Tagetes erecta TaxID=13708 RepID=A0AAD8JU63_TARER|nr:hypothetical protein QVD17_36131 [Tagetes erecta]